MMLLGGLLNLTLGIRGVGMLIGGPGGAALAMYAVGRLTESKALRRTLKTLLGVAWTADLLGAASLGLGALWGRLAGVGLLRRILVYAGAVSLLAFTRGGAQYDTRAYRRLGPRSDPPVGRGLLGPARLSVRRTGDQPRRARCWTPGSRGRSRICTAPMPPVFQPPPRRCCWKRAGWVWRASQRRRASQQSGRAERPRLRWSPELEQRYRPFGLIEDGDTVIVEDEPVIQNGRVLEKGHVRKQR